MNRILQLQQEKAAHLDAAQAILAKAETEKRGLTPEELTTIKAKQADAQAVADTIAVLNRQAELAGSGSPSVRDNSLDKPFGPEARGSETPKQRKSRLAIGFGNQLKAIMQASRPGGSIDPRLLELNQRGVGGALGANESVPADGGFLVHQDYSDDIMVIAHETGIVHTMGRKIPISEVNTNGIKIPGIDEQSRSDGSRWGGVRMFWQNEADTMTGSRPKFRMIELILKKLTGLFYATDEVIADAGVLGDTVSQAFGEEVGFKMDDSAFNGDGAGKPQGVAQANNKAMIVVAKETGQAQKTILVQNVAKMWYRLHARSRKRAVWFVNQDVEQQLLQLSLAVGTGGGSVVEGMGPIGGALYIPAGARGNETALLFGRPVIAIEQAQTIGTQGDIALVDMTQWCYIDRDLQQAASMHVQFITDQMTFRWIYRVDGQPQWHTALTPFNGSNTQSPYITLAAR